MLRVKIAKEIALCKPLCCWDNWNDLSQEHKDVFLKLADRILSHIHKQVWKREKNPFKRKEIMKVIGEAN